MALVIGDHPERPFQSHELTADWTLVRFHWGRRGRRGNYSESEIATWARRLAQWRRRAEIYAYFNNDWEGFAPRNALGAGSAALLMARFVIQQHDASSMHYDFRLEVEGVLASWAVPKGPSTDPREKRLAVQVGDHALEYADFEGVHERGYGAGAVIVWDNGTYDVLSNGSMREALDAGHASFWLHGHKLRGGYTLQRTRGGEKPQWLLISAATRRPTPAATRSRPSPSR